MAHLKFSDNLIKIFSHLNVSFNFLKYFDGQTAGIESLRPTHVKLLIVYYLQAKNHKVYAV